MNALQVNISLRFKFILGSRHGKVFMLLMSVDISHLSSRYRRFLNTTLGELFRKCLSHNTDFLNSAPGVVIRCLPASCDC